jgi:endoglucanase
MNRRRFLRNAATYAGALGLGSRGILGVTASGQAMAAPPSPVFLNQLGYLPGYNKVATVAERGSSFTLRSAFDSSIAFRGELSQPVRDAASGDLVQMADFSLFNTPGRYWLEVNTGAVSELFTLGPDVYGPALWMTMRSYFGQRCGCAVDMGGGFAHPPCHLNAAWHPSSGKKGPLKNHGGWHDAGDYGRYIVNSGITTGTLLWAWEFFEPVLHSLNLQIPESGGKIPDYLAEVQWNLNWMLTLQDKDGGVWHKQTSEQFCGYIQPQDDHSISYVIGTGSAPYKSTCATADFAAVMAIAARCYTPYAHEFAQRCLNAARQAWRWCLKNPNVVFQNPPGISTGSYSDPTCWDDLLWAAAELWRTTGEVQFQQVFLNQFAVLKQTFGSLEVTAPSWGNVSALGLWSYAIAGERNPDATAFAIRNSTQGTAEMLIRQSETNGYGNTLAITDYIWGSNGVAANQALLLILANHFQPSAALNCALNNLHYLLGRNCFGLSWVTQLGTRPFQHPHHRPSMVGSAPWPGLLSGGPNAQPDDSVANTLPHKPPMHMYIDNQFAYSVNEVAINWNAPLVFLLAAAHSLRP